MAAILICCQLTCCTHPVAGMPSSRSRYRRQLTSKRQNDEITNRDMRVVVAALLFLVALFFVLVTGTKDNYTIHIGARTPPVEAGCSQVGEDRTDEGKVLGIYSCPA